LRREETTIGESIPALLIFGKPLTLPCAHFMQYQDDLNFPIDMQFGLYALYEEVLGEVGTTVGLTKIMASMIEVKQGRPLSSICFQATT
jgi:hypothetical protein